MQQTKAGLRRRLTLPLLVLYGVGITIGAGIYVLIGSVAAHAGAQAPLAFIFAGAVMAFTVGSYAELCGRYPVSAGEAAYVKAAFRSRGLSTFTGLLTLLVGIVSSAAVAVGSAGYIQQFVAIPTPVIVSLVVILLSIVAAWGILESVLLASIFTIIEVGGLLAVIAAATFHEVPVGAALLTLPTDGPLPWMGIAFGSLLAFFAFVGFEDLANVVEEAKNPNRDMPWAMAITLGLATALYVWIAAIAVAVVPLQQLAESSAPLTLVYRHVAGISPATISAIAIVATLNTVLALLTMASRILYGMAGLGDIPRIFGYVHHRTSTPLIATAAVTVLALIFALLVPFERLAEWTSVATLLVFAVVNLALIRLRWREKTPSTGHVRVPLWVPVIGLLTSLGMMAASVLPTSG
jgi:basic amino acid/polyamine antiporter, APA family